MFDHLQRTARRWGLVLSRTPTGFRLGAVGGSHPYEARTLAEVARMLDLHRSAMAGRHAA